MSWLMWLVGWVAPTTIGRPPQGLNKRTPLLAYANRGSVLDGVWPSRNNLGKTRLSSHAGGIEGWDIPSNSPDLTDGEWDHSA